MIKIVDYGLGNILAFQNVYKRLNVDVGVARSADELAGATRVILPGVGAFDHAMELLDASGMRNTLDELVLQRRVPVLGICVGMQILARASDEAGAGTSAIPCRPLRSMASASGGKVARTRNVHACPQAPAGPAVRQMTTPRGIGRPYSEPA